MEWGGLVVDAMSTGCLGVERRGERARTRMHAHTHTPAHMCTHALTAPGVGAERGEG